MGESTKISVELLKNGCLNARFYEHTEIPCLVDTGATITCVRDTFLREIQKSRDVEIKKRRFNVHLADGSICHVRQAAVLKFKIHGTRFEFPFSIIPNLTKPVVLGTDFLKATKSQIEFDVDPELQVKPVRAVREATILPFTELAVLGQVTSFKSLHGCVGTLDNLQRNNRVPYLVQKGAVSPTEKNRHPIILLNTSHRPYKVRKGDIIALFTEVDPSDLHLPESDIPTEEPIEEPTLQVLDTEENCSDTESDCASVYADPETNRYDDIENELSAIHSEAHDVVPDIMENVPPKCVLTDIGKYRLEKLLDKYEDVFVGKDNDIGTTHLYTHSIHIKPDAVPCHYLPYRQTPEKQAKMGEVCEDLVRQGILRECAEGPWASRSFLVQKASGGQRLVTDLRHVNANMINQALSTPRADDTLDMIGSLKPTVFSKLDAQQGFFQIPIRREDQHKTAFIANDKKYVYEKMPMGLSTAPAGFCHLVTLILNKLKYKCALPYLDDILVLSSDVERHFSDLEDVFKSLRVGKLKLKKSKCEYFTDRIDFLGMRVTPDGLQPSPEKVECVKTFPTPKSVKQVRSFTGLCQYFKKFIKDYANIARPLYDLQTNLKVFKWNENADNAFKALKHALCTHALLRYPDYDKEFSLATDASNVSLGAVLSQRSSEGVLRPVAFAGRTLSKHERNYNTTERELLGVVYGILHFRHYLESKHFQLYTDHAALIPLLTNTGLTHRWARWALDIQQFQFTIQHVKGDDNIPPDVMSRREYPDAPPMTNPPPPPRRKRAATRTKFSKIQTKIPFSRNDPPINIDRPKPVIRGILKETTHYVFCHCEREYCEEYPENCFTPVGSNKIAQMVKHTNREPPYHASENQLEEKLHKIASINNKVRFEEQQLEMEEEQDEDICAVTTRSKAIQPVAEDTRSKDHPQQLGLNAKRNLVSTKPSVPTKSPIQKTKPPAARVQKLPQREGTAQTADKGKSKPQPKSTKAASTPTDRGAATSKKQITITDRAVGQPKKQTKTRPAPKSAETIQAEKDKERLAQHIMELDQMLDKIPDTSINSTLLKEEQRRDTEQIPIIDFLEKGDLPVKSTEATRIRNKAQQFLLLDNILVHISPTSWRKTDTVPLQVVIPKNWIENILQHFHDSPMAGHVGTSKMMSSLIPRVYWKSMMADVNLYVSTCDTCLKAKRAVHTHKTPMTVRDYMPTPMMHLNLDAVGPLPETARKNKHIQVCIDYSTRYVIAYATKDLTAENTQYEFYKNVICQQGVPTSVQTDNGTCYTGSKFKKLMNTQKIRHDLSSPYRPQSNGLVERFNASVGTALRTFCSQNQRTWDLYIESITFALNNTESQTTGYTPFFLLHGRNPRTIVETALDIEEEIETVADHVSRMIQCQDESRRKAIDRVKKLQQGRKSRYDKKLTPQAILPLDIVYINIPRILLTTESKKLQPLFMGPYVVAERPSPTSARLKNLSNNLLVPRPVHIDRLKKVTTLRKNEFAHRLIPHTSKFIDKITKNKSQITLTKDSVGLNNIKLRPAHHKVKRTSKQGRISK